ncbi:MAG: hypothetical protein MJ219_00255 [Mycoplasmoidaceae bacterium]|nr:hypothetical protein [Mycoplasmoidaceae bacterium]
MCLVGIPFHFPSNASRGSTSFLTKAITNVAQATPTATPNNAFQQS